MLSTLWQGTTGELFFDDDKEQGEYKEEVEKHNQQQEWGQTSTEADGSEVHKSGSVASEALRAIWDTGPRFQMSSSAKSASADPTPAASAVPQRGVEAAFDYEEPKESRERSVAEAKHNLAKAILTSTSIETISDAWDYCEALVKKQLERADEHCPDMNTPIYGDSQARRAISTLLPDEMIRDLFMSTTKKKNAWPRIRSLFGVPPYNFLKPDDAGMVRAAGIASGRVNMTYSRSGETAGYSQFGTGHLVDSYMREYRIVPTVAVSMGDSLPCDIDSLSSLAYFYLNVRVPKRSREEKLAILKSTAKRRSVVFPCVGEEITLQYSDALRRVWGNKANDRNVVRAVVKSIAPRSATSSTAAVLVVKV